MISIRVTSLLLTFVSSISYGHILIGDGDVIKCDYNSKAYNDKIVCLPEYSTNYRPSYISSYQEIKRLRPGEVVSCNSFNSGDFFNCVSDRFINPPMPEPVITTKIIEGFFTKSPNVQCFKDMPGNLVARKQIVTDSTVGKRLVGEAKLCDQDRDRSVREDYREDDTRYNNGRRGFGRDRRNYRDGYGRGRQARLVDFNIYDSTICKISYTNLDQSCYNSVLSKAAPNTWREKKDHNIPKPGQLDLIREACSVQEIYCQQEVDLNHPVRGYPVIDVSYR